MVRARSFAIYLSENKYNMEAVCDAMEIIYTVDKIVNQKEGDGGVKMSRSTLIQIQNDLTEYVSKMGTVKMQLEDSLRLLKQIALDRVQLAMHHVWQGVCECGCVGDPHA